MLVDKPQVFDHEMFGSIQIVTIEGKEMFGATQVALALGYKDPNSAVRQHCKSEGAVIHPVLTSGGTQQMKFISEGNVYRLIARSKLPGAVAFERWVFDEILPSIRKNGMYVTDSLLDDPELLLKTVTRLAEERRARIVAESRLIEQAPKVEAFDTFISADGLQTMGDVAKSLGWGRNRLYAELRDRDILMNGNKPYQRFVNDGYFTVKQTVKGNDEVKFTLPVTMVTARGVAYIERLLAG
jgi:prophage antirepressor-like protein